jgi:hypothetical protein
MDQQAQERVIIAKDALKWIRAGALLPQQMMYVSPIDTPVFTDEQRQQQLRDVVIGKCEVCVKGAIFLSKAFNFDNVLATAYLDPDAIDKALEEHFSIEQYKSMERTFEAWNNVTPAEIKFIEKYPQPKQRMMAILKNVIKNKGTFMPEKL